MKPVFAALALLPAIMTSRLVGQEDGEASRRTLAGLKGVYVLTERISDDAQRDGLTEDQVRTDVELKLRQAGITVLSLQQSVTRAGAPHLYVRVTTLKNSVEPFYAYHAEVELDQNVKLIRNPSVTSDVATWSATILGTVGAENIRHLREVVRDLTDQFINAYLAANPKRWWCVLGEGAHMTKTFAGIMLLVLAARPGSAQDWRAQLKADAVVIRGGKMVYDEVGLYKLKVAGYEPAQVQVKVHSEAPQGGLVSRDNFVSLTTLMFSTTFIAALSESYKVSASQFMQGLDYTQLKSAIGTPDLELNLTMTNEGMQLEVVNTASGQRTRQTMTWDQVFAK